MADLQSTDKVITDEALLAMYNFLLPYLNVGSGGPSFPTGGTAGQVLTKQSATDGDADWDNIPHDNTKANSSSLAPVETSTTSEHAYEIGDHLMLAGGRFLVTADIAVGDTLDVSTNIQAVSIEDETGLSQADFAEIITPLPGKFVGGLNYSTEEQVIGTWIDGKPIYQKSLSGVFSNSKTWNKINLSDIDKALELKVFAKSLTDNRDFLLSGDVENTSAYTLPAFYDHSTNQIWLYPGSQWLSSTYVITLQYTKTTDPTP